MKTISLPEVLPGNLDLSAINTQLREGTAQLDWSATVSVRDEDLAVLLDGLDLSVDAEVLGIEGNFSDNIALAISQFFRKSKTEKKPRKAAQAKPEPNPTQPQVWSAPVKAELDLEISAAPAPVQTEPTVPPESRILVTEGQFTIRAKLEESIVSDLLGPVGGPKEEVDERHVSDRYLVGMLAPRQGRLEVVEDDDEMALGGDDTTEEGTVEPPLPVTRSMFPSSIGMTFCVSGDAKHLKVSFS